MLQARRYGMHHGNKLTLSTLPMQSLSSRANYTDRLNKVCTGIIGGVHGANAHQLTPVYRTPYGIAVVLL
jgi:hypothetical protein